MIEKILMAGISGAIEGLILATIIILPKFLKNQFKLRKHLKECLLSDNEYCPKVFEHKNKSYNYIDFLTLRTINIAGRSENSLLSMLPKRTPPVFKSELDKIDFLSVHAAIILKAKDISIAESVNYVIEHCDELIASENKPIIPQKSVSTTVPKRIPKRNQYFAGENISLGKHYVESTSPDGGLIHILSPEHEIIKRKYVRKKSTFKVESDTKINLYNCKLIK